MMTLNANEHAILDLLKRVGPGQHLSVSKIGAMCFPEAGEYDTAYSDKLAKRLSTEARPQAKSKAYRWAANGLRKLRKLHLVVQGINGYAVSKVGTEFAYELADGQAVSADVPMTVQEIKAILSEKKVTIARLAAAADMPRQRASDLISRGRGTPKEGELDRLSKALRGLL